MNIDYAKYSIFYLITNSYIKSIEPNAIEPNGSRNAIEPNGSRKGNKMSRRVIILGAKGRFGHAAADAFLAAGWQVRSFARSRSETSGAIE